jgi:hypothetical protein
MVPLSASHSLIFFRNYDKDPLLVCIGPGIAMEEGQPLKGIALIGAIPQKDKSIVLDEYRYEITPVTRFYTQNGKPTSPDKFIKGLLVEFVANEQGQLLSLREEFDLEGEFAQKRNGKHNVSASPDVSKQKEQRTIKKKSTLHLENGVWKN